MKRNKKKEVIKEKGIDIILIRHLRVLYHIADIPLENDEMMIQMLS